QNSFWPEGGVCKNGFLIKSPPLQLFNSQNSWKRRFFILSKSSKGSYILKYLKGQNIKGSIDVDQIINIQVGISKSEMMEMVRKMFKCLPEQVMSISTGNRCYYLIASSRQETEDWVTMISSICRDAKRVCQYYEPAESPVSSSSGPGLCTLSGHRPTGRSQLFCLCVQENSSSEDKNRPNSDPGLHAAHCDPTKGVFPSLVNEDITKEDYYQTPSNILAKVCLSIVSSVVLLRAPRRQETFHGPKRNCRLLDEFCQLKWHDGLPPPSISQDDSVCPRDLDTNRDLKFPENSTNQQLTLQRRQNSLPLSVVQLSILLNHVTDETQLQKLDIFIPLADINSYLKLTEAAGQI
ncbi:Pleckstrin homology domain-containing family S member 1, partial [Calypte anna]